MNKILAALTLCASCAVAHDQAPHSEFVCTDVPAGKKIVLIPWFIPPDELKWTWHPVMRAEPREGEPARIDPCAGDGLVVSPCVSE